EGPGAFEGGEARPTEGQELRRLQGRVADEAQDGDDLLAVVVVRQADDGRLGDPRMLYEYPFDLGGIDVVAPAQDEVLRAVDHREHAVCGERPDVAASQPAIEEGRGRGGLIVEITGHHVLAPDEDLAGLVGAEA